MQLASLPSSDDALLADLVDVLTTDPDADMASAWARVEQQRATQSTGVRREQRQVQRQQERSAALRQQWTAITTTAAASTAPSSSPSSAALRALVVDTNDYFSAVCSSASSPPTRSAWRTLSAAPAAVSHAPELVVHTLHPLLSALTSQPSSTGLTTPHDGPQPMQKDGSAATVSPSSSSSSLRCAYLAVLPAALRAAAPPLRFSSSSSSAQRPHTRYTEDAAALYAAYTRDPVVCELLTPYLHATVAPLEKALRYHFSPGRETARIHEPQHFFAFLADCVGQHEEAHASTWAAAAAGAEAGNPASSPLLLSLLRDVGQLALAAAAVVVFQHCYGWQPHSPLWRCSDYVVVTVNAVLDFIAGAEGRLCAHAAELMVGHLLEAEVVHRYAAAGVEMAMAAYRNGPARLWRRAFLLSSGEKTAAASTSGSVGQPALYTGSLHLVRALEAFLRRLLNTLLVVAPPYAVVVWGRTVEPVLARFLEEVEAQAVAALEAAAAPGGGSEHTGSSTPASSASPSPSPPPPSASSSPHSWDGVHVLQWCVASVQLVTAAAEDWLGMLRDSAAVLDRGSAAGFSSDALDGLTLFRDRLARRSAEQATLLTRRLCAHASADGAVAARLLYGLDDLLRRLESFPDESSRFVLLAVIQKTMQEALPREQQVSLVVFANSAGLSCVVRLLAL